jgi:glycosyltransferase involved in cell wall biosynthesis
MTKPRSAPSPSFAEAGRTGHIVAHNGGRGFGGGEGALLRILHGLAGRGHAVTLFCEHPSVLERAAAEGIPAELFRLGGDGMLHRAARFAMLMRRRGADALIVATYRKFLIGGIAGRLARLPRVVGRIGTESDMPRKWKYRLALRTVLDAVVFNAESMRRRFLQLVPWYDPARAVTIHGGILSAPLRENNSPHENLRVILRIPPHARIIGSAGRLVEQKRFDRLLRVTAMLPDDVHCMIAGRGHHERELRALAEELGIARRVHLIGFRDDLRSLHDALDLYLVTSNREGMSNAMLEAMAAGVPVVSTPVSGAHEALEPLADGTRPGIVTRDAEDAPIAEAARAVLSDDALRSRMAAAARARVEERFTWERMVDGWEALLLPRRAS